MENIVYYNSPIGKILLAADNSGLTGLWFIGQKYYPYNLNNEFKEKETPVLKDVINWLNIYFKGIEPDFIPSFHFKGTSFQEQVWKILLTIPYGKTTTYGKIAEILAKQKGILKMSAQAVGNAVGHNRISIIIPCHRVLGVNNSLNGYAGGIDKKIKLLKLEGVNIENLK